jgi:hypothetical protein
LILLLLWYGDACIIFPWNFKVPTLRVESLDISASLLKSLRPSYWCDTTTTFIRINICFS